MKKTAIVYDKWLSSMGGGEVVAGNFARILADLGYDTTIICGRIIDKSIFKKTLNIDLSDIKLIENWNDETTLTKLTANTDIFINVSFLDYSLSLAKKNILYIFFPNETDDNLKDKIITRLFLPVLLNFIKPVETISQAKFCIYYLKPQQTYHVKFEVKFTEFSKFQIEKLKCTFTQAKITKKQILINHFSNSLIFDFEIVPEFSTIYFQISHPNLDNLNYTIPQVITPLGKFISLVKYNDRLNQRLRAGIFPKMKQRINNYQHILATSDYTKKWISKYWQRSATTFYAPAPLIPQDTKAIKKNQICTVGRFFTTGHNKKQDVMIEAFKKLYDNGLSNWEFHLAGGLNNEESSKTYVNKLKQMAKGYPIFLHLNPSRELIEKICHESKIYWHAAGFGIDKEKYPVRFEHFGITPIEGISAGCIPVLFDGGGLRETVTLLKLDPKIHLFSTIDELITNTKYIIRNNIQLPKNYYKTLSQLFGFDRFKKQLIDLINSKN